MKNDNNILYFKLTPRILQVLEFIFNNPGSSVTDIAEKLNIPISTVSKIISILEDRYNLVKKYTIKNTTKIVPAGLTCSSGVFIFPRIFVEDDKIRVSLAVWYCPYKDICQYKGHAFEEGKCKFYDELPKEDKEKIQQFLEFVKKSFESLNIENNNL